MATCSTETLLADGACYACLPPGLLQIAQTSLLCRIAQALTPGMTCDVQTLLSDGACFACLPPGMLQVVQAQLLCEISAALTGGVGQQVLCGDVAPTTAPTNGCSIYYDRVSAAFYFWNGASWSLKV